MINVNILVSIDCSNNNNINNVNKFTKTPNIFNYFMPSCCMPESLQYNFFKVFDNNKAYIVDLNKSIFGWVYQSDT